MLELCHVRRRLLEVGCVRRMLFWKKAVNKMTTMSILICIDERKYLQFTHMTQSYEIVSGHIFCTY